MSRPSRRRITAFAGIAAVATLFAGPATGSAGAAEISLDVSKKEIKLGKSTKLSGELSGVTGGANGNRTVSLLASPYPYDEEAVVTATMTEANGKYSFGKIKTELNTRYTAIFEGTVLEGDAASSERQVFVFPKTTFKLDVARGGIAKAKFAFRYSDQVEPEYLVGRRDLNWYFRKTTQNRFKRIDRTKFSDTASGVEGKLSYRLPRGRYRFFINVCVDAPAQDIGFGNDKPFTCPKTLPSRVNRASARGLASSRKVMRSARARP